MRRLVFSMVIVVMMLSIVVSAGQIYTTSGEHVAAVCKSDLKTMLDFVVSGD